MKQPEIVLLDTTALLDRFQEQLGDYGNQEGELLCVVIRNLVELLGDWKIAPSLLEELANDLADAYACQGTKRAHQLKLAVVEVAHAIVKKIEDHKLVDHNVFYYDFLGMQGHNILLRSAI